MTWIQYALSWIVPGIVGALLMLGIPALVRWIKSESVVEGKLKGIEAKIDTLDRLVGARLTQVESDVRHEAIRNDEQDRRHGAVEIGIATISGKLDVLINALQQHGLTP